MAATCVASALADIGGDACTRQKIQKCSKMHSAEPSYMPFCTSEAGSYARPSDWRYRLSKHTASLQSSNTTHTPRLCTTSLSQHVSYSSETYLKASALVAALLQQLEEAYQPHGAPPSYSDETAPPPYPEEDLASVVISRDVSAPAYIEAIKKTTQRNSGNMDFSIDFGDTSGAQTRGGKKATKKAAKQAQQSKWLDSGDEGSGAAGEGGEGGDGFGAGGDRDNSAGGGGDDNGGGGGDDNIEDWDLGGKKNKKKTKKQKDEEEAKKREEEEAANANSLSWADETNTANAEDEWTTGFASKKDKKKKKKGAEDPLPAAPDPPGFQDISLDDGAPKLEFSFGGNETKKDSGSFGAWGKTWDFGGIGAGDKPDDKSKKTKDIKEADTALGDNNPWSFSNTKPKKKTTTSSGFDFGDFGANNNDYGLDEDIGDAKAADDAWGFSAVNKKDKKKGLVEEKKEEETKEDDSWSAWGTSSAKKDKKKTKKGAIEEEPIPPPPPAAPVPDPPEDDWSFGMGSKKDKKKSKRGAFEEVPAEIKEEPVLDLGEPESTFDWGFGTSKKDKDKKKKSGLINEIEPEPVPDPPKDDGDDDDWMKGAFGKKDKKKTTTKKSAFDDLYSSATVDPIPDTNKKDDTLEDDAWGSFGTVKGKKDKKSKKGIIEEEAPPPPPPELEPVVEEDTWASFGKKSKDKKTTKKTKDINPEPSIADPEPKPAAKDDAADDLWSFGLSAKDKKKKEKELATGKKGKVDFFDEPAPAPEPSAPAFEEDDLLGNLGVSAKDKKKKDKMSKAKSVFDSSADFEPEPKKEEDPLDDLYGGWGTSGLSAKDKKKKEKEDKKKKEEEDKIKAEEEAAAKEAEATKPADDDIWGSWGAKPTKKTGKKGKLAEEPPPPAPTPPAQGLTPEPDAFDDVLGDDGWGSFGTKSKSTIKKGTLSKSTTKDSSKSKDKDLDTEKSKSPIEEAPAKTSKSSMWGFGSTATTSKPLTKKERDAKAKKEAEEQSRQEEEERLAREAEEAEAARLEEEKKAKKSKVTGKLSKTTSKTSDKVDDKKKKVAEEDALIDLLGEPTSKSSKLTKSTSKKDAKVDNTKNDDDYFGTWGSASTDKKTAGKKEDVSRKEIKRKGLANQHDVFADLTNDLDFGLVDDKAASTSKTSKTMLADKSKTASSSVKDRIKQLESKKEDTGKKLKGSSALTKDSPPLEDPPSPKEEKKTKDKASATSKLKTAASKDIRSSSKKTSSPAEEKKSKDSVPGSFPGAFGDDDSMSLGASFPEKARKGSKLDTKSTKAKPSKKSKLDDLDLLMEAPVPPKLPTPPPDDKKSSKKDRPTVQRAGTSSWGFWGAGAPPKKSTKDKSIDDADFSPPPSVKKDKSPPGLSRSKSTRTPKEKEKEERRAVDRQSKSSGSEQDTKTKTSDRPTKPARGTSFSSFVFGGAPPSAMKAARPTTRRSSTAGSRSSSKSRVRDSLPSPPPDNMNDKAAKMMGVKTSKVSSRPSVKAKSKVPDPYPIDSDDMVMINAPDDSPPMTSGKAKDKVKTKASASKSKAENKSRSKTISQDDDVVMVDSNANGDPLVTSGPDDMAFVDHPPSLKRSNTATKRATGFFGSFFGASKAVEPEEKRPRSTTLTDAEDQDLPIRTKSSRRKSKAVDDDFTTDVPAETTDADGRRERKPKRSVKDQEEADRADREGRRKERRDREKADLEARRSKARDRDRKEQEVEDQRREDKRARRAKDNAKRIDDFGATTDAGQRREERRRLREQLEGEGAANPRESKEDRKQQFEDEEEERRRRREDRKSKHTSRDERDRGTSSKKKTSTLAEEYHQSRNKAAKGHLNHVPDTGKTSSWIDSQADDPPDIPPLAETVLDPSGQKPKPLNGASGSKKKDKYAGMIDAETDAERRERRKSRRERVEKTSASGHSDEKRKSRRYTETDDYPVVAFDGAPERPGMKRSESKRKSFLGGFF